MRWNIIPYRCISRRVVCLAAIFIFALIYMQESIFVWDVSAEIPTPNTHQTQQLAHRTNVDEHPCLLSKNIVFLKTHKCASSTVQNIFIRFGLKHGLSFAIPFDGHTFHYPENFNLTILLRNKQNIYNILCHHLRFDYPLISSIMPIDTTYVTIVRNVIDTYESSVHYFVQDNETKLGKYIDSLKLKLLPFKFYSRNPMLFDFGVEYDDNVERYHASIRQRMGHFDLIMIAEYFDESLILLKHLLCLEMSDIVYVKHNVRAGMAKTTAEDRAAILEWNAGDVYLYELANRTFWERVQRLGYERIRREVNELRRLREQWETECIQSVEKNDKIKDEKLKVALNGIYGFNLRPETETNISCRLLVLPELNIAKFVANKQRALFP